MVLRNRVASGLVAAGLSGVLLMPPAWGLDDAPGTGGVEIGGTSDLPLAEGERSLSRARTVSLRFTKQRPVPGEPMRLKVSRLPTGPKRLVLKQQVGNKWKEVQKKVLRAASASFALNAPSSSTKFRVSVIGPRVRISRVAKLQVALVATNQTSQGDASEAGLGAGSNPFDYGQCTYHGYETRSDVYEAAVAAGVPRGGKASSAVYGGIPDYWWNGWRWADNARRAGFSVGSTPAVGALAVYPRGWGGSAVGHVAYVVEVLGDGRYRTTDRNVNRSSAITQNLRYPTSGVQFVYGGPAGTGPGSPPVSVPPGSTSISLSWTQHSGEAKRMAVTRGAPGTGPWMAFHIGMDSAIYWKRQSDSGWTRMAETSAREISAMTNPDGRVEVFHVGADGSIWHSWQSQPNGPFGGWVNHGGNWHSVAVTRGYPGGWEAYAVGMDRRLYRLAPWVGISSWTPMETSELDRVAAMTNPDGRIELFVNNIHGSMYHNWQGTPGGGWAGWVPVAGQARDVAMVPRSGGGWEQYHVGFGRNLFVRSMGGEWRHFAGVEADRVAVTQNEDGREEVFHINSSNGSMWHAWQTSAGRW